MRDDLIVELQQIYNSGEAADMQALALRLEDIREHLESLAKLMATQLDTFRTQVEAFRQQMDAVRAEVRAEIEAERATAPAPEKTSKHTAAFRTRDGFVSFEHGGRLLKSFVN